MEELAVLTALVAGGLIGLACSILTSALNPWLGGAASFGVGVTGMTVLAGAFDAIPEGSIVSVALGVGLLMLGSVMGVYHMSRVDTPKHSKMWTGVAPVIGGVVLPEKAREPTTLVGTYARHEVKAFVVPAVDGNRSSGSSARYVVQLTTLSKTPEWKVTTCHARGTTDGLTVKCSDEAFRRELLHLGVLKVVDRWFREPGFFFAGQGAPAVGAGNRDGRSVLVYSTCLHACSPLALTQAGFQAQLDLLIHLALLAEQAKLTCSADATAGAALRDGGVRRITPSLGAVSLWASALRAPWIGKERSSAVTSAGH